MPGLWGRTMTIVKAKFSRVLDRAENPSETLDYSYEEQLRQLQNVKRGIADVATAKKRPETKYKSVQQQMDKLDVQTKIEQFRSQKEIIKAQYSAAEAQVRIGEAATGISTQMSDVGAAVQRAKDKTLDMQARADAIDELTQAGALEDFTSSSDDIDRQLAQIQQGGQVDAELEQLKSELGQGSPQKELQDAAPPEAAPAADAPAESAEKTS